ncbi:MAG: transcription initiation factor IIB family protein [Metallosphaera sp.]
MKCQVCGGEEIIFDPSRGIYVCKNDGVVVEDHIIDQGPEWREFDSADRNKKRRVGSGVTERVHDKGFTTVIGGGKVKDRLKVIRLQRLQNKSRVTSKDKKLVTFLSILNGEAARMGLPNYVKEEAAFVIRRLIEMGLARRIDMYVLVGITLFYVARMNRIPVQLNEIKEMYNASSKTIWDCLDRVQFVLKSDIGLTRPEKQAINGYPNRAPTPLEYIPKIVGKTNLPQPVETKAAEIAELLYRSGLTSGKGYLSTAAAIVYLVSALLDTKKTQKEMAESLKVTEVTIRNRYKEIIDSLDIDVLL